MSNNRSQDRSSRCSFAFVDGRQRAVSSRAQRGTSFSPSYRRSLDRPAQWPRAHRIGPSLTTFRINTYKSVSKQRTLTTFRINTYAKRGEGGKAFRFSRNWRAGSLPHPQCPLALPRSTRMLN